MILALISVVLCYIVDYIILYSKCGFGGMRYGLL